MQKRNDMLRLFYMYIHSQGGTTIDSTRKNTDLWTYPDYGIDFITLY